MGFQPNRVGPLGLMQVAADMIKMFFKEDWIPPFADKWVFVLAPTIVFITMLLGFAVIPFAPGIGIIDFNFGLLYFLALSSLSVYSIVLAGYASNNKYSLLGGLRAAAHTISYEVFMGISIMGVVMCPVRLICERSSRPSAAAGLSCRNFSASLSS